MKIHHVQLLSRKNDAAGSPQSGTYRKPEESLIGRALHQAGACFHHWTKPLTKTCESRRVTHNQLGPLDHDKSGDILDGATLGILASAPDLG
jgi:hypothetical protein